MAAYRPQTSIDRVLPTSNLPCGTCNFKDLASGNKAPTCGCRRFWLNQTRTDGGERAWCFCGHHACFHNSFGSQLRTQDPLALDFSTPPNVRALGKDVGQQAGSRELERPKSPARHPEGLGIQRDPESQSINFRVWDALNGFARQQEDGVYSEISSKLPSTAVPSTTGDIPPSNFRLAGQPGNAGAGRMMGPPLGLPAGFATRPGAEDYIGSATELATPSVQGTPDLRAFRPPGSQAGPSSATRQEIPDARPPNSVPNDHEERKRSPSQQPTRPQLPTPAPTVSTPGFSPHDVQNLLQSYGHRLDVLENLSFNQVPVEEIQDRFDYVDARIHELEGWHRDVEQRELAEHSEQASQEHSEGSNRKKRRLLPAETASFGSDGSFDSAAAAHTEAAVLATLAANAETGPRIDALEDRVADLENAAGPSYTHPWEVQVVLLPWGRDLRGIWFSSTDATQQTETQEPEEWVPTQTGPNTSYRSRGDNDAIWTTESIEAWATEAQDWLSPKACGPNTTVFQRLASRGLVREVSINASDAGTICSAVSSAFKPFQRDHTKTDGERAIRYLGLRQPFIPLRKVRKSSRLRYLSPAEMVTPATWTARFLDSSVFMKVQEGQRRLYITTPEAYEQFATEGATWSEVRNLPMRDAHGEEHAAQVGARMVEACWTYNDKLDYAASLHSSFRTHASPASSRWDAQSQSSDEPIASPGPVASRTRAQTTSLPNTNELEPATVPARRVTSFGPINTAVAYLEDRVKRRRLTVSPRRFSASTDPEPEALYSGINITPRHSKEPPSPYTATSDNPPYAVAGASSSQGPTTRGRGTTPFAYATPHSNSHFVSALAAGYGPSKAGDGDTEAGTDLDAMDGVSERGDEGEEWEGVDDESDSVREFEMMYDQGLINENDDTVEPLNDT